MTQVPTHFDILLDSLGSSLVSRCVPVWRRSTHTCLIDSILNDTLRIVTGCLRPTPAKDLPVHAGIQPAELRRSGATLSLANRATHDPSHVLHGQLVGQQGAHQGDLDQDAHLYLLRGNY